MRPVIFSLLILNGSIASAAEDGAVDRRTALKGGSLAAFVGLLGARAPVATPPPPAPVLPAVTAADRSYRTSRLSDIDTLRDLQFREYDPPFIAEPYDSNLTIGKELKPLALRDIFSDWVARHPEIAKSHAADVTAVQTVTQRIEEKLAQLKPEFEPLKSQLRAEMVSETLLTLRRLVVQKPWSDWNWTTVFKNRLFDVEVELANEFQVPVASVYRAADLLYTHFTLSRLLRDLEEDLYSPDNPPLFSEKFLQAYCDKVGKFSPLMAEALRRSDLMLVVDEPDALRRWLSMKWIPESQRKSYGGEKLFKFQWKTSLKRDKFYLEDYLPLFSETQTKLRHYQDTFVKAPPSRFRTLVLEAVAELSRDLEAEFATLPQRLKVKETFEKMAELRTLREDIARRREHKARYPQADRDATLDRYQASAARIRREIDPRYARKIPWDSSTWQFVGYQTPQEALRGMAEWANTLRTAGVAFNVLNDMFTADLSKADAAMAPASDECELQLLLAPDIPFIDPLKERAVEEEGYQG